MRRLWHQIHRWHWLKRWGTKLAVVGVVSLLILYPDPRLFGRQLLRMRHPDALVEPDAPDLHAWSQSLYASIPTHAEPREVLRIVESAVYERLPYAFDWETWGVVDYLPTVTEAMAMGREDCDGRAVVAASLLRGLGYDAHLVADGAHMWVWTPDGETMSPNAVKTVIADADGWRIDWRGLKVLPRATAFGIAVFPLGREVAWLAVLWLVLIRPGWPTLRLIVLAALLAGGLVVLRSAGRNWHEPWVGGMLLGAACAVAASGVVGIRRYPAPASAVHPNREHGFPEDDPGENDQ